MKKVQNKKGQVWSFDIVIAILIFFAGVIILFFYAINYSNQSNEELDSLFYQGNVASEIILSGTGNFGILTDGKIDQSKLNSFYSLTYEEMRAGLGIKDDFYFVIGGMEINGVPTEYVGMKDVNAKNNIKINRFVIYKNKIVKFQIYIWT